MGMLRAAVMVSVMWMGFVSLSLASPQPLALRLSPPPDRLGPEWMQSAPFPAVAEVPVEVGDDLAGAILDIVAGAPNARYRIQLQYETSLTISDEGPHVDLLDWKHCVSDWEPVQATAPNRFVLPAPSPEQAHCFPDFTHRELVAAARKALSAWADPAGIERWIRLLDGVRKAGDGPTYAEISKVRMRVEVFDQGRWQPVTTVEFVLPMGC